jgi:hypothetical protein
MSSIQMAGQAVHDSCEAIAATVRTQAEGMVSSMATAPFSAETEQAMARFKTLSKLCQGLCAMATQLQQLYAIAVELSGAASDVIVLQQVTMHKASTKAAAVDVIAKPAKANRKTKKIARESALLTVNDKKLLRFFQRTLKGGKSAVVTGSAMSAGAGIPSGSVGQALKKILIIGAVRRVGRGTYELGAAIAGPAAEAVVNRPGFEEAPTFEKLEP